MRSRIRLLLLAAVLVLGITPRVQAQSTTTCGLSQPAFCDTFDAPAGTGNRSGQLNGTVWGASRLTGNMNFSGAFDNWQATQLDACGSTSTVMADNDIAICNGQVREATNDGGTVSDLAMYPKQPFDFAGRTGKVTFDVTNDTSGTHGFWPEFWLTDRPIPVPDTSQELSAPQNGFGIRFAAGVSPGQYGFCPNGNNLNQTRFTVDSADIVRGYAISSANLTQLDCAIESPGPDGPLNHFEIDVSQNQVDVYASDPGTTTMHHLAVLSSANLSLTRGLIWISDVHYNAAKDGSAAQHTFTWDNVGFDGPVLAQDRTFDVPDPSCSSTCNLGWFENSNQIAQKQSLPASSTQVSAAAAALLTTNFYTYTPPTQLTYSVNGHMYTMAWPFPDTSGFISRTIAVPVNLSDVIVGNNVIGFAGVDQPMIVFNMDLILAGAGGTPGTTGTPTSTPAATSSPTSTPTLTPTPPATATATPTVSATSTATSTSTVIATSTAVATRTPAPSVFLNPGQSVTVVCSGSQLSNHWVSPDKETLRCS